MFRSIVVELKAIATAITEGNVLRDKHNTLLEEQNELLKRIADEIAPEIVGIAPEHKKPEERPPV